MNNPYGAFTSDTQVHLDDMMLANVMEDRKFIRSQQQQEAIKSAEIGSLKHHAGWQHIKQELDGYIENFRSGRVLSDMVKNGRVTEEELGRELRVMMLVAERLEKIVKEVEAAAEADMHRRLEERNGRQPK